MSLCAVWPSHSKISSFSTAILALGKIRSRREPNLGCSGADRPGWCDVLQKKICTRAVDRAGALMYIRWSALSVIVNATVRMYHTLSQRRVTADWLAPRESDCSRLHSTVSSDWLPSYMKATLPVLEIFKMPGYFPNWPSMSHGLRRRWNWAEYEGVRNYMKCRCGLSWARP